MVAGLRHGGAWDPQLPHGERTHMAAEFSKYAQEKAHDDEPVELPINNREGEPYIGSGGPAYLLVVGEFSKLYRDATKAITNKVLKQAKRGHDMDADEIEQRALERIAAGVVGWGNIEDANGVVAQFSREGVLNLFKAAPWIAKQAEDGIQRHASFFAKRSSS